MAAPLQRLVEPQLRHALTAHAAVLVSGPRACGKTTTALAMAAQAVRLDTTAGRTLFQIDPDAALARASGHPLLIDEWQEVPAVMGAIKRAADGGAPPGRFLLTGSVRGDTSDATWPGTGRLIEVRMGALAVREQLGHVGAPGLVARLTMGAGVDDARPVDDPPDIAGYLDLAVAGGFPEPALRLDDAARGRWYDSYVQHVVKRDVLALLRRADPARVRRYLEAYALNSAGVVDDATLVRAAGINRRTATGYEAALSRLFVIDALPAWTSNRLTRMVRMPKRVVADTGLLLAAARLRRVDVTADPMLLGRVIETLVINQVQHELRALGMHDALFHLRDTNGRREVDLIIDLGAGRVVGIEVKSTVAPGPADARHLAWLRDSIGPAFVGGIVLHTGPYSTTLGDRLVALPIAALWDT